MSFLPDYKRQELRELYVVPSVRKLYTNVLHTSENIISYPVIPMDTFLWLYWVDSFFFRRDSERARNLVINQKETIVRGLR